MKTMRKRTLSMVFLLAMVLVCLACPEGAKAAQKTDDTFTSYKTVDGKIHKGEYTIPYILKNYNIFTTGSCGVNHVVGPVIVGEMLHNNNEGNASLGGLSWGSNVYRHQVPSYVGSTPSSCNVNYFSDKLFFYTKPENNLDYWIVIGQKNGNMVVAKEDQVRQTDHFMDSSVMDQISDQITQQKQLGMIKVAVGNSHSCYSVGEIERDKVLNLKAGQQYQINFEELANQNIRIINVISSDTREEDLVVFTDEKVVNMPSVYYNGQKIDGSRSEIGKKTGLVFMAQNATEYNCPRNSHGGHIVAPQATVNLRAGDFNGCIIAKEIRRAPKAEGNSEGHMWPYNGQLLNGVRPEEVTKEKTGTLIVKKTVVDGTADDLKRAFNFTITYTDKAGNLCKDVHFELKNGESRTFELKAGTPYTVKEDLDTLFSSSFSNDKGTILDGQRIEAVCTNTKMKTTVEVGSLLVTNTVTGPGGDKNLPFYYTVTYEDADGNPVCEKFSLKHDEKREITGIPAGRVCTVVEEDANKNGYTTNKRTYNVQIVANASVEAKYINDKPVTPAAKKTVSVEKVWVDHNNPKRPASVSVQLYKKDALNGNQYVPDGKTVTLNAEKQWKHVWNSLDTDAEYEVKEVNTPDGYRSEAVGKNDNWTITNMAAGCLTITNTVEGDGFDPKKKFTYTVTYIDGNGSVVALPEKITLANGERKSIKNLPVGVKYTVTEIDANQAGYAINGSTSQTAITNEDSCVLVPFINNFKPTAAVVNFEASKTLDGKAPAGNAFSFILKDQNGKVLQTKNNNGGKVAFDALTFNEEGQFTYTLSEVGGNDSQIQYDMTVYEATVKIGAPDGKNTYQVDVSYKQNGIPYSGVPAFDNKVKLSPERLTNISVRKIWNDYEETKRPDSVMVQLYKNSMAYGNPVELNAGNSWKYLWKDMDSKANWSVNELNVPEGYEKAITQDGNHWTITNTLKAPAAEKIPEDLPQTGDSSSLKLLFALGCMSLLGVAVISSKKR